MNGRLGKKRTGKRAASGGEQHKLVKWGWFLLIIFVVLLFCTAFIVYQNKKTPLQMPVISTYYAEVSAWISSQGKIYQQDRGAKVTSLNGNEPNNIPLHFEFYNTLPKMQLAAPPSQNQVASQSSALKQPIKRNFRKKELPHSFGQLKLGN